MTRGPQSRILSFKGFTWVDIHFFWGGRGWWWWKSKHLKQKTWNKELQRSDVLCSCSNYKPSVLPLLQIPISQLSHLGEWKVYCITNHFTIHSWYQLILMTLETSWHLSQMWCLCETKHLLLHLVWAQLLKASSSLPPIWPGYMLQLMLLTLLCKQPVSFGVLLEEENIVSVIYLHFCN